MDRFVNFAGEYSAQCEVIADLINPEDSDGSVGGQLDAPVFDQERVQNACLKHVLHGRPFTLYKKKYK